MAWFNSGTPAEPLPVNLDLAQKIFMQKVALGEGVADAVDSSPAPPGCMGFMAYAVFSVNGKETNHPLKSWRIRGSTRDAENKAAELCAAWINGVMAKMPHVA